MNFSLLENPPNTCNMYICWSETNIFLKRLTWPKPYNRVSKSCDRATVRSRKILQRLRKIWVFEHKNAQFIKFLPFLFVFWIFFNVLDHCVCAKLSGRHFGRAKKFTFIKSAVQSTMHTWAKRIWCESPSLRLRFYFW